MTADLGPLLALAHQPFQVFDQWRDRSLDHVEHLGVSARWPAPRIGEVFVAWHRKRVPPPQQLDLHGFDRKIETSARLLTATQSLEISDAVAVHGDDQIVMGEVIGMDLSTDVTDVVAAQASLVGGQRVRQVADMATAGRGRVEGDMFGSTKSGDVRRDGVGGWRSAVIAQAHEKHAKGLGHT